MGQDWAKVDRPTRSSIASATARDVSAIELDVDSSCRDLRIERPERVHEITVEVVLIHEGDKGGDFNLITDGTMRVTVDGAEIATLGAGSYAGEMALIDGGARTATVTAVSPVASLALSPTAFLHTVDREPDARARALCGARPPTPRRRGRDRLGWIVVRGSLDARRGLQATARPHGASRVGSCRRTGQAPAVPHGAVRARQLRADPAPGGYHHHGAQDHTLADDRCSRQR